MNWKYRVVHLNGMSLDEERVLNKLGEQGWELVSTYAGVAYLKAQVLPEDPYVAPSIEELMEKTDKVMTSIGGVKNQP